MSNVILPSSPADRKSIKEAVMEIDAALTRIEAERDHIKNVLESVEEKFSLPKSYVRKVANAWHKQNLVEQSQAMEDVEAVYETIFGM
jgi:uncharacterized protein YigA (DUF484 family)